MRAISFGHPEGGRVKIFGFNNASQERIFASGDITGSMSDKTFVHCVKISDSMTPILFGLADILLGTEGNGVGGIIIMNTCPPKSMDDSIYFLDKGFGEKNRRHVDRNRGKEKLDVSGSASVVQFVHPDYGKFGTKFVENEIISFALVPVIENNGMTKVHGIIGRRSETGKIPLIWFLVELSTFLLKRIEDFWKFEI